MILLRLISWPYARKHVLRCLLTMAGIVLGVGVFVGMHTANQSVLSAFHDTIDRIAGSTQLQVSSGETGFGEDVLEQVRSLPEVRAAAPVIEATANTGAGNLLILGVDMLGDRNVRNYDLEGADESIDDPLVFLAQADSLLVTKTFADKRGLKVNSRIPMRTMQGDQVFTIRGIMKPGGLASAFGGDLAIMDIYAAQKVFGRGYRFDRVDIVLEEGVGLDAAAVKARALLGAGFEVEPPQSRGQQFEATSKLYATATNVTSMFALFIGMFIIYNTFAIAVTERRSEIGILRALGATRAQVRTLFLVESAVSGLVGTAAGILFGIALANGMASYIGALLSDVYGVSQNPNEVSVAPWLAALAAALGLTTSLIAAYIPARAAAGVDPVKALQKGRSQTINEGENRTRTQWAFACVAVSTLGFIFSANSFIFYGGAVMMMLAAVLLCPAGSLWVARGLRPVLSWLRPVEGTLAIDSLIQAPRRTSGTIAALMLSLALVISLAGLARASYDKLAEWMRVALSPDLYVTTAENITNRTFTFPNSLGLALQEIPGVARVQAVRSVRIRVKDAQIMLFAADVAKISTTSRLPAVQGDSAEMYRLTAEGKGVIAAENFVKLHGAHLGEELEFPAPGGLLKLPIVGVVRDFADQQGGILMSRAVYIEHWKDDTVNSFQLYLSPGANNMAVRQSILDAYGSQQKLFVLTNAELRDFITRITDQWFGLTYIQIFVAVLVAILGIVNALTVSITNRRRELGVLQAVGALRNQVRHTIWMEAAAIGIIGVVLGLILGGVQLYYSVEIAQRDLIGTFIGYSFPYMTAAAIVPVMLAAAFLAAIVPAESAVRGSLIEALEYE